MARGVNKSFLLGRLGKDPELRHTQNGTAVASFSLATTERTKVGGEWQDKTEWHNIVVWARQAELCSQYLQKGSEVYIEGRIQTRKWQDRDGNTRYITEIVSIDIQFLSKTKPQDAAPAGYQPTSHNGHSQPGPAAPANGNGSLPNSPQNGNGHGAAGYHQPAPHNGHSQPGPAAPANGNGAPYGADAQGEGWNAGGFEPPPF